MKGRNAFAELDAALTAHAARRLEPNVAPRVDLADVGADLSLRPWRLSGVVIPFGQYGWTREARPLHPWATTEKSLVGSDYEHAHDVSPREFTGGDVVRVEFLWDNRHPLVTAIVEFPGS